VSPWAPRRVGLLPALVFALIVVGSAGRAGGAEERGQGDAATEELLKQGIALRRSGDDEAALAVFLDLEKRNPDSVRVFLHVTAAAQATGKWLMAYEYLQKALDHKDDPYFHRHRTAIESVEKAITQRVGQFRARGLPAGAEVRLSGELIGTLPMNAVRAVEGGSYVLEVSRSGYYPLRRTITIAGGAVTQEAVDLRKRPIETDPGPGQAALQIVGPTDASHAPAWWQARWVGWSLVTLSAAAAVTSGTAFAVRESKANVWNDDGRCLDAVDPQRTRAQVCNDVRSDIKLAETVGITAGVASAVLAGAAIAHWVSAPVVVRPARTRLGCTPGLGSIACYGSF
jgi:tetratricopeptide (TPR) repeat protein